MSDRVSPSDRRRIMQSVPSKNTQPELRVRSLAHRLGFRFRIHRLDLLGTPDLVFPRFRTALFVHGCFWHQHKDLTCGRARLPKSRIDYWKPKLLRNIGRDRSVRAELERLGWRVGVIWECQTGDCELLAHQIQSLLCLPDANCDGCGAT